MLPALDVALEVISLGLTSFILRIQDQDTLDMMRVVDGSNMSQPRAMSLKKKIDAQFLDTMESVDIVIMCYFAKSALFSNWAKLEKKCKMIVMLDVVGPPSKDQYLKDRGYEQYTEEDEDNRKVRIHLKFT